MSSLSLDRTHKASLYARAGVKDYWIVNLVDRVVEVHRDPARDDSAPYGWSYATVQILAADDAVSPALRTGSPRHRHLPARLSGAMRLRQALADEISAPRK